MVMHPAQTLPSGKAIAVRRRPAKTRGNAISAAASDAGAATAGAGVCAATCVAAPARVTCLRNVRRLVGIRYRVIPDAAKWGRRFFSAGADARQDGILRGVCQPPLPRQSPEPDAIAFLLRPLVFDTAEGIRAARLLVFRREWRGAMPCA